MSCGVSIYNKGREILEEVGMIRRAKMGDLDRLVEIFEGAKAYMRAHGNLKQWADGYPARSDLAADIENGNLYVMEDGEIYGAFAMIYGDDPTYEYIEGAWNYDGPYVTIHRIAQAGGRRGVFKEAADFALTKSPCVRVDTHEDNGPMRRAIVKAGFSYCGIIFLADGNPRLAYQIHG